MKKEKKVSYAQVKGNTHWPAKVICIMDANQREAGSQVKVMEGTKEKIQHIWTPSPKEGGLSHTEGGLRNKSLTLLPSCLHFSD